MREIKHISDIPHGIIVNKGLNIIIIICTITQCQLIIISNVCYIQLLVIKRSFYE